ncbi:MAG TPA: hypothetical protein ENN69_08385, partial [Spirochaetia bacterium]|nr:hypothetical protein [Spirochaetia bacterium]
MHTRRQAMRSKTAFSAITAASIIFIGILIGCSAGGGGGGGEDTTAPTLDDTLPVAGALDVDNNTQTTLTLTFNENVTLGTGNIVIYKAIDDSVFDTIGPSGISGAGSSVLTVTLNKTLAGDEDYYVQIAATLIADTSANPYAGITDTTTWTFSTVVDATAPLVTDREPSDNAADVPTSLPELSLTFNEDVHIDTVGGSSIEIRVYSDDSLLESVSPLLMEGDGTKTIEIPFGSALTDAIQYYVVVPADLFSDYAGTPNYFAGISDKDDWNFTAVADASAPVLQSTTPADNET